MKRKQVENAEGSDARTSKRASRAQEELVAAAPKLVEMPDELVKRVLEYMGFVEQFKLRLVCRRIKGIVDVMPRTDITLEVEQIPSDRQGVPPWGFTWIPDTSTIRAQVKRPTGDETWTTPCLRAVRPTKLQVKPLEDDNEDDEGCVELPLLQHLAEDVGGSVSELCIVRLHATEMSDLLWTFLMFAPVTKLELSALFPLSYAVTMANQLRDLVSLKFTLTEEMVPEWVRDNRQYGIGGGSVSAVGLSLAGLSSLPKLRSFTLHCPLIGTLDDMACSSDAVTSFMLGCTAITQIKCLKSNLINNWGDPGSMLHETLAKMLGRMSILEELNSLSFPKPELWRAVHKSGGHKGLRKLVVEFEFPLRQELEALVEACIRDFPALNNLELHFGSILHDFPLQKALDVLKGLKYSHSLCEVNFGFDSNEIEQDTGALLAEFRQAVGEHIVVNEIMHIDDIDID